MARPPLPRGTGQNNQLRKRGFYDMSPEDTITAAAGALVAALRRAPGKFNEAFTHEGEGS